MEGAIVGVSECSIWATLAIDTGSEIVSHLYKQGSIIPKHAWL